MYYHKHAVERLECTTPNKRTSQHADFKSYQLSTNANVQRKFPHPCPSLIMTHMWGMCTLWECLYGALCTKAMIPKRITAYCCKRCIHCRLMEQSSDSSRMYNYQRALSQIMHSSTQLSAILAIAGNFYCKEIESMMFTFSLSFTSATRLVPSQGIPQPCYLFTQNSH